MAITVVTPATNRRITIAEHVKDVLGIGDDDLSLDTLINRWIDQVTSLFEERCNRVFAKQTYDETVKGYGGVRIMVSQLPILTLTSVKYAGTAIDAATYDVDADTGIIYRSAGWYWTAASSHHAVGFVPIAGSERNAYTVRYTAGYRLPGEAGTDPALPYGLEILAIEQVKSWYLDREVNANAQSFGIGGATLTRLPGVIAPAIAERLQSYAIAV